MRLVNWKLHSLIVAFLFCLDLHAQTQGNLPQIIDGYTSSGQLQCSSPRSNCVKTAEAGVVGDLVVVGYVDFTSAGPPWTVNSLLGNVCTTSGTFVVSTATIELAACPITVPGVDELSVSTCTGCLMEYSRYAHITGTQDGSVATVTSSTGAGLFSAATSKTTTVNGALLVSASFIQANSAVVTPGPDVNYAVAPNGNFNMTFRNTGVAGAYSSTHYFNLDAGHAGGTITAAFKPSGIGIVDTVLPYCANGQPLVAQLHAVGGSGAYTFSATAGAPGWLSVSSSGALTGTCATGISTVTFQVTDGTLTSTTNLAVKVFASAYLTPTVADSGFYSADNGGGSFTISGTNCGDMIVLYAAGDDTHGTTGYVQAVNGLGNFVLDSKGSSVVRAPVISGGYQVPEGVYLIGPLPSGGSDQITLANNTTASSALHEFSFWARVSGVQPIVDLPAITNQTTSSTSPIATSYTTPVANELLIAGGGNDNSGTPYSFRRSIAGRFTSGVL
jgi:hypothetical protein